jgi:glycosyltransferase involved in cell wall biosynthesis
MKKICFLSDRNIYMQKICSLLVDNNFEVHLICRDSGGLSENLFQERIIFHQLSSNKLIIKIREIKKILRDIKPNYVHVQGLFKDAFIPRLTFTRHYKNYLTIWGSDLNIFSRSRINKIFQNIAIILCDKIHLLSEQFYHQVRNTYFGVNHQKVTIFSWGIDFSLFQNPDPKAIQKIRTELNVNPSDTVILSYRNHKALYNHHTIVKSMISVVKSIPNAKYVFVRGNADDSYVQQTYTLVRENRLKNNFAFINHWLSNTELCALVNMAKICINIPSKDGLPATLFEIMATRAIPIVSSLDNYQPFFKNGVNGFYLKDINNSAELAKIIITIINNYTEIAKAIYSNNNQYIMKYQDWNKNSKMQIELYD